MSRVNSDLSATLKPIGQARGLPNEHYIDDAVFDEEKKVADKAPIETISVNDLNSSDKNIEEVKLNKFDYTIKIADFYFKDTAITMLDRIKKETSVNKIGVQTLSNTQYRVFLGPFYNINSLQKAFNDINVLQFENIEIIKNEENN